MTRLALVSLPLVAALALTSGPAHADDACSVDAYSLLDCSEGACIESGGSHWIESGGSHWIESGGSHWIESGGSHWIESDSRMTLAAGPDGEVAVATRTGVELCDVDGDVLWTADYTEVAQLAFAPDGDVVALELDRDTLTVSRLDARGRTLWSWSDTSTDDAPCLVVDDDGTAWITATTSRASVVVGIDADGEDATYAADDRRLPRALSVCAD